MHKVYQARNKKVVKACTGDTFKRIKLDFLCQYPVTAANFEASLTFFIDYFRHNVSGIATR